MVDEGDEEEQSDEDDDQESLAGVTISGKATLTEADYLAAWNAVPQFRWLSGTRIWFGALLLGGLLSFNFMSGSGVAWVGLAVPLVYLTALTLGLRRGKQQFSRNAINDAGGGTISYRFSDAGVGIKTARAKTVVAWESLAEVVERPAYFLVYTSPQQFVLVAKRAFTADDIDTLQQMFAERIVKKPLRGMPREKAGRMLLTWVIVLVAFLAIWHFMGSSAP